MAFGVEDGAVEKRPGNVDLEEAEDGRPCGGDGEDSGDHGIGQQGHPNAAAVEIRDLLLGGQLHALAQAVDTLGLPHTQEDEARAEGDDAGHDVGELVGEEGSRGPLGNGEGDADDGRGGAGLLNTAHAVKDKEDEERHDGGNEQDLEGNQRGDVSGLLGGAPADRARGGDWDAHRAEGHGRGVGNEHRGGRLERLNTQGQDHGGRNCYRSAEAGKRLQQAAEAESDEDGLDANIAIAQEIKGLA